MLKYNYNDIPQNVWDKKAVLNSNIECKKIKEDLLIYLRSYFESYHNKQFDLRSIDVLLGNWLLTYVSALFDRSLSIKNIKKVPLWLSEEFDILSPPFDYDEFGNGIARSEDYNRKIYQLIYQYNKGAKLKDKHKNVNFLINKTISPTLREKLFFSLSSAISKGKKLVISYPHISFKEKLYLATYLRNFALFDDFICPFHFNLDTTFFKRFRHLTNNSSWEHDNIYLKLLPYFIPTAYLECYKSIHAMFMKHKNYKTEYFFTSIGLIAGNPFLRIFLSKQKNIKILNRFHGGGYKIYVGSTKEDYERRIADIIYCFGKKKDYIVNEDKYLAPNYYINKPSLGKKNSALFILTSMPKYVSTIAYQSVGIKNVEWFNIP